MIARETQGIRGDLTISQQQNLTEFGFSWFLSELIILIVEIDFKS